MTLIFLRAIFFICKVGEMFTSTCEDGWRNWKSVCGEWGKKLDPHPVCILPFSFTYRLMILYLSSKALR